MSTILRTTVLAGLAAATALTAPAMADKPGDTDTTKTSSGSVTRICHDDTTGDDNTVVLTGPLKLFPPNHKMVDESVVATSDPDTALKTGTTSLMLHAAEVGDVAGGDGGPNGLDSSAASTNADTDGDGVVTAPYQVRAERSGKGEGRTYTIAWDATFDDGSSCSSTDDGQSPFTIFVPHDQRTTK